MQKLTILGSTGSIGTQTLDIVRQHPHDFRVVALATGSNVELLTEQIREFQPRYVAVAEPEAASRLPKTAAKVFVGRAGVDQLATIAQADMTVSAISGIAGLTSTIAAIETGAHVALANKESLVVAGDIIAPLARKTGATIFPIDSEHSGLWQLLRNAKQQKNKIIQKKSGITGITIDCSTIRRAILTASGGALRDWPIERLAKAEPADVLAHPTWNMGAKITVDSATLANKAFEIIEAHHLFDIPYEKIEAMIHPQSIVHAMLEFNDGSTLAQLAKPDMHLPIQLALFGGLYIPTEKPTLPLRDLSLEFKVVDPARYPLFEIIIAAGRRGGLAPAIAATSIEIATEAFLSRQIDYLDMVPLVRNALKKAPRGRATLAAILRTIARADHPITSLA